MPAADLTPRARAAEWLASVPDYVWDGRSLPVPLERIADSHCGLRVRDVSVEEMLAAPRAPRLSQGETLSGLLLLELGEIWVNADEAAEWPGRRRFTIGHELGHWVLHHGRATLFCRSRQVVEDEAPGAADIEEEASLFGGALLLPPALVRAHWDGDLEALSKRFGASRVATERAVVEAVLRPRVDALPGVELFYFDDPAYETWRAAHRDDGFVLNQNIGDPEATRLHTARCSYLNAPVRDGRPRTRSPKLCATDRAALPAGPACGRCKP